MQNQKRERLLKDLQELGTAFRKYPALLEIITLRTKPAESGEIEDLTSKILKDPQNTDLYNGLGVLLLKGKRFQEAEKVFRQAIRINPLDSDLWCNLGTAMDEQSPSSSMARKAFERAIKLSPDTPSYYIKLADTYLRYRLLDYGIAVLDKFMGGKYDDPSIRISLALAYRDKKLYGLAIDQLEIATQLTSDPSSVEELEEINKRAKKLIVEIKKLRNPKDDPDAESIGDKPDSPGQDGTGNNA